VWLNVKTRPGLNSGFLFCFYPEHDWLCTATAKTWFWGSFGLL